MFKSLVCRVLSYCFLGVLASASTVCAAYLTITPAGGTKYTVQSPNLDGVSGIYFNVQYNTNVLSGPTMTAGSAVAGAIFSANTQGPGLIRVAIINGSSFSGGGVVATISFATKTANTPLPVIVSPQIINANGTDILTTAESSGSSSTTGNSETSQNPTGGNPEKGGTTTTTTGTGTTSASTTYAPGTITLPTDLQRSDPPPVTARVEPPPAAEPTKSEVIPSRGTDSTATPEQAAGEPKAEEPRQSVIYTGIVDKFKLVKGAKTLEALTALFATGPSHLIRQEPAIVLSNGKEHATLTIDLPERLTTSPNFSMTGGNLVSFKQDTVKKGRWSVVVLPEVGAVAASITVVAGADDYEVPLTVTPVLTTKLPLNEQGWETFQREVGTPQSPLHDFNGDGIRNHLDEFIFVANYLVQLKKPAPPAAAPEKPVKTKTDYR